MTISVCITSFNSGETLDAVLASVAWADERIVLDSGSTDDTAAIAARHDVQWHVQPFAGFAAQKQRTIDLATGDWVLLLDSDEVVSPELARSLQDAAASGEHVGYTVPRRELQFWRMSHPSIKQNRFLRLARREHAAMSDRRVHETLLVDGSVGDLSGELLHYGERSVGLKVEKINTYSTLGVTELKRPARLRDLLVRPPWYFFRHYLLKRNCLNGRAGLIASGVGAFQVFLKYAKAIEANQQPASDQSLRRPSSRAA